MNESVGRRLARRLALLAASALLLGASFATWAEPATAGEFTERISCTHLGSTAEYWQTPLTPGGWTKTCLEDGVGMRLKLNTEATESWRPTSWMFPKFFRAGLRIKHVTAVVRGSNGSEGGVEQGLLLATNVNGNLRYGPLKSVSVSPDEQPQTIELDASELEGGADYVLLGGRCAVAICGPQNSFEVLSVDVTFSDEIAPTLGAVPSYSGTLNPWLSSLSFAITDTGSGVSRLDYKVTDSLGEVRSAWTDSGVSCRPIPSQPYVCGTSHSGSSLIPGPESPVWGDGLNRVTVTAYDRAGSSQSKSFDLKADVTPPGMPQNLRIEGLPDHGWTSSSILTLRWRNPEEVGENDDDSGIRSASIKFVSLSGQGAIYSRSASLSPSEESTVTTTAPAAGHWRAEVVVLDAFGNRSPAASVLFGVDDAAPPFPTLEIEEWYGPMRPTVRWTPPVQSDPALSGICDYETRVDYGFWHRTAGNPHADFDSYTGDGGHAFGVRSISCAGIAGASAERIAKYDGTRPSAKLLAPRDGWLKGDEPMTLVASDDASGVAKVTYSVGGGSEESIEGPISSINLPDGVHTLRYGSEDKAGNKSLPGMYTAHFDSTPPSGWIEPFDADRPTLVTGVVSDTHSGVATSKVQYRAFGAGEWRDLDTDSQPLGGQSLRLQARFPDEDLNSGVYELRVFVTDNAGHLFTTGDRRIDGTPAVLNSPLRQRPRVRAAMVESTPVRCGRPARGSAKKKCFKQRPVEDLTVDFGQWSTMRGDVFDAGGGPVPHGKVVLLADEEPIDGKRVAIASGETNHDGHFEISVPPGVNRKLTATFPGGERSMPAEDTALVRTRTAISLSASRRRVRPGQKVVFKGRVRLGSASLSNLGLHYLITSADGEVSIKDRRTDPSGRFSVSYVVPRFGRPVTLRLRAAVRHEYGWPYSGGASKTVSIKVAR